MPLDTETWEEIDQASEIVTEDLEDIRAKVVALKAMPEKK